MDMGASGVFSAINASIRLTEFVIRLGEVGEENDVFVRTIQRVRSDLLETQRQLRHPEILSTLSTMHGKLAWIDDIINSAKTALVDISYFAERARGDHARDGSVKFSNRLRWVMNDHEKLENRCAELAACHQSLLSVLALLNHMQLLGAHARVTTAAPPPESPGIAPPAYDVVTRNTSFRSPYARRRQLRMRASTENLNMERKLTRKKLAGNKKDITMPSPTTKNLPGDLMTSTAPERRQEQSLPQLTRHIKVIITPPEEDFSPTNPDLFGAVNYMGPIDPWELLPEKSNESPKDASNGSSRPQSAVSSSPDTDDLPSSKLQKQSQAVVKDLENKIDQTMESMSISQHDSPNETPTAIASEGMKFNAAKSQPAPVELPDSVSNSSPSRDQPPQPAQQTSQYQAYNPTSTRRASNTTRSELPGDASAPVSSVAPASHRPHMHRPYSQNGDHTSYPVRQPIIPPAGTKLSNFYNMSPATTSTPSAAPPIPPKVPVTTMSDGGARALSHYRRRKSSGAQQPPNSYHTGPAAPSQTHARPNSATYPPASLQRPSHSSTSFPPPSQRQPVIPSITKSSPIHPNHPQPSPPSAHPRANRPPSSSISSISTTTSTPIAAIAAAAPEPIAHKDDGIHGKIFVPSPAAIAHDDNNDDGGSTKIVVVPPPPLLPPTQPTAASAGEGMSIEAKRRRRRKGMMDAALGLHS